MENNIHSLKILATLWPQHSNKCSINLGIIAEFASRSHCDPILYFKMLLKDILPYVKEKSVFFQECLLLSFFLKIDSKLIVKAISETSVYVHDENDLETLAEEVWKFNRKYWKLKPQWVKDTSSVDTIWGRQLRRKSSAEKEEKEKQEYLVWYNDTEPEGESISRKDKNYILNNEINKLDLLIIKEEAHLQVFICGNEDKPPGPTAFKVLYYILKHKGYGGTSWNLANNIYNVNDILKLGDGDYKDLYEAIKYYDKLEEANKQKSKGELKDKIAEFSKKAGSRIKYLNKNILKDLDTKLEADSITEEYSFVPMIKYCLIEERPDL